MAADSLIVETAYDVLSKYGRDLSVALRKNLIEAKNFASGELADSIHFKVLVLPQSTTFELYMAEHWKWVDKGRGPTKSGYGGVAKGSPLDWQKPSLRKSILKWMSYKGIVPSLASGYGRNKSAGKVSTLTNLTASRSMATAIARSIHRKGYIGSGFFTKAMKGEGDLKELEKDLAAAIGKIVKATLIET